ncbi:MAG: permease-like cell division protein FtsX [Pseudomonadota bacterium]
MGLRVWVYFFKCAFLNILDNRFIHLISVGTISISLLLFGSFMLFSINLNTWVAEWGKSLSMSVYLKEGIDLNTKERIESRLTRLPGAVIKGFISKEEAMVHLTAALGSQASLLDGLERNPLPASFEIVFNDVSNHKTDPRKIKESLESMEGVEEVQYSEQWVERLEGILYIIELAGLAVGGLLCLAVLFITTNTIKLNIYSRRDEIEIFKLVGATDWFVKTPFIIEGAVQGMIGGLLSLLILYVLYSVFSLEQIHLFGLSVLEIVFLPGKYAIFLIFLGLFLGLLGGFIAIGRFFRL